MKYIVGEMGNTDLLTALIFHEGIEHSAVAPAFNPGTITSAGFVNTHRDPVKGLLIDVYGKSISLNCESNSERDAKIIKRFLTNLGIE